MAETTYVARPTDLAELRSHFEAAKAGEARIVVLEAPVGGGKRVLVNELLRASAGASGADDNLLLIRANFTEDMDGMRALMALYAGLCAPLYRDPTLRGKVEVILNAQLPQHPKRVQSWFQVFIDGLKKNIPQPGADKMQLAVPSDNPLLAFTEIVAAIAKKMSTVLEIQNIHVVHSVATFVGLDGLFEKAKGTRLFTVLASEPVDDAARAWMPAPFLDLLERRSAELTRMRMSPWTGDDVAAYAATRNYAVGNPNRVAELVQGRPGFIGELLDHLSATGKIGDDLATDLMSLIPTAVDEEELDAPPAETKEGQRKHATVADAPRLFHLAALLGVQFPSGLLADMAGFDRDSVDDLMDAAGELVKEDQFHQGFGTWLYQFKKPLFREAIVMAHRSEEDQELARRVGVFMERVLAPRGRVFVAKTARIYAENAAGQRANVMRSVALGQDEPNAWSMAYDAMKHFGAVAWPEPMRRTVYLNLVERMVTSGEVEQAEKLIGEALAWATERQDRPMEAWLLFAGSRLDFRRSDLYRARDRARDAAKLYAAVDDKAKSAEIENHLASIELQDGNANAALDHIRKALELANVPPIAANAEYLRGLIARRAKRHQEAAEHFRKANETAGQLNMGPLALESGFHYGESLFLSQQTSKAADVLARVAQIAQQLQNPVRERSAASLLAQAHGQLKNYEAALQMANRTLQLSQALKFEKFIPVDIYNVGFYNLSLGRATEAASLFGKARERAGGMDARFLKDLNFNAGIAYERIGERNSAETAFGEALSHCRATKDWRRFVQASDHLANLVAGRDKMLAAKLLQEALQVAENQNLKEERKGINRRLKEIGS
jgi:tetratricopeptide (TPR) repeat protein